MKTEIINTFDGGQCEDPRTFSTSQNNSSKHFDIYSNQHMLRPFSDMVADTANGGSMTDFDITDVIACDIGGTTKLVGWGRESSASTKASFFTKDSPISTAWTKVVTAGSSVTPVANTLTEYKGNPYAIDSGGSLIKLTSGNTYTSIGSIGTPVAKNSKPFVHPEDNVLYCVTDYAIAKYDGSTFTANVFLLPSDKIVTSITSFGTYLAIAMKPNSGVGRSTVYLWGRDTSLTTVQGIIDWGDGSLEVLENIQGILVGVSAIKPIGTFDSITNYNYQVKVSSGETAEVVKDVIVTNTNNLRNFKAKQYNKLYFGFDTDDTIYVTGKNKNGEWFVSKDRYITPTGGAISGTLDGISLIGDKLFSAYTDGGTSGYLAYEGESTWSTSTPSYRTTVNPGMPTSDRYETKKLVALQVVYEISSSGGTSSGSVGVSVSLDGGSETSVISKSQSSVGQYTTTAQAYADSKPFDNAKEIYFVVTSTGAVRIKELRYKYDVVNTI